MTARGWRGDAAVNLAFAVGRAAAVFLLVRIAGVMLTTTALGVFLLARRLSGTWACLVQLGISQTILRSVAQRTETPDQKRRVVGTGMAIWAVTSLLGLAATVVWNDQLVELMFKGQAQDAMAFWTVALLFTTVCGFVPYSTFLGERWMITANVVELLNASGFFIAAFLYLGEVASPLRVIQLHIAGSVGLSLVATGWYLARGARRGQPSPAGTDAPGPADETRRGGLLKRFATFGVPRSVGAFLEMLVLLVGPWVLRQNAREASYLLVALTLIRLLQMGVAPISQLASVVVAKLVGDGRDEEIARGTRAMFGAVLYGAVVVVAIGLPWLDSFVVWWLGAGDLAAGVSRYAKVLIVGVLPYALYQALKGIVEMRWYRPLNLVTLVASLFVQLVVLAVVAEEASAHLRVGFAVVAAFWVMGSMTVGWLIRDLTRIEGFGLVRFAALILALVVINVGLARNGTLLALAGAVVLSTALVSGFVAIVPTGLMVTVREMVGFQRRRIG